MDFYFNSQDHQFDWGYEKISTWHEGNHIIEGLHVNKFSVAYAQDFYIDGESIEQYVTSVIHSTIQTDHTTRQEVLNMVATAILDDDDILLHIVDKLREKGFAMCKQGELF